MENDLNPYNSFTPSLVRLVFQETRWKDQVSALGETVLLLCKRQKYIRSTITSAANSWLMNFTQTPSTV